MATTQRQTAPCEGAELVDIPVFLLMKIADADYTAMPEKVVAQAGTSQHEFVQVLRAKTLSGNGIIAIASRHNLRQFEIDPDGNIDPRKTSLNVVLRGALRAADVAAEAVSLMAATMRKPLRKNAALGIEILFDLPTNSGIDDVAFFSDAVAWAERFFEIPILSAVIHNDEAAPHCHVILLPLFDGRLIGTELLGNRQRIKDMQADFHAKVGQRYGLKRGTPAKRYSRAARASASDRVVAELRRSKNKLDEPAIRDALRDVLIESMPLRLMELLGLDMPKVKTPKPKTFASIMTKNCPERKPNKTPIVNTQKQLQSIGNYRFDQL